MGEDNWFKTFDVVIFFNDNVSVQVLTTIMEAAGAGLNAKQGRLTKTACFSLHAFQSQPDHTKGAMSHFLLCG